MRVAADGEGSFALRLGRVLNAKLGLVFDIRSASPHGDELISAHDRLCGDIVRETTSETTEVLHAMFSAAQDSGEFNRQSLPLDPASAAALTLALLRGIESEADLASAQRRVEDFTSFLTTHNPQQQLEGTA